MKKTITIIAVFVISFALGQQKTVQNQSISDTIQKSTTKKADRLFERMWYKEAAAIYKDAVEKERSKQHKNNRNRKNTSEKTIQYRILLQKTGDAYYFNTDMKNAVVYYDMLIASFIEEVHPEYIFRYAHALQGVGEYRQAKRWMKQFAKRTKNDDIRPENFNQEGVTVEDILNIPPKYTLKNISINTKYSDFGPMYYQDQLVFSSARDTMTYHTRIYHWNEQPFLDMYLGELNALESDVQLIEEFSENINTKFHEATLAFSLNQKKVYFTRNNYDGDLGRDDEGVNHLKLYSADLRYDDYENDEERKKAIENGKYRMDNDSLPRWTNIKELPFNSEEYSVGHPTISVDGKKLYFVSDMPGSIGATDIFVVDILDNDEYSQPKNLGATVNTSGREMFPFITDNTLYFASDGHLGLGGLDVFESDIKEETFQIPINLGAPLNSKLDDFGFILHKDKDKGFVCSNRLEGKGDDDIYSFIVDPTISCTQVVEGVVRNKKTKELIPFATVSLYDQSGKEIQSVLVGEDAAFTFQLNCSTKYLVRGEKQKYSYDEKSITTPKTDVKLNLGLGLDLSMDLNLTPETSPEPIVEFKVGDDIRHILGINIIYFDFDKDFIRSPDATAELQKVILFMKTYPKVHIDVRSHTDSRASDRYNLNLSKRRNKSTIDYIVNVGGIDRNRLTGDGYGETQLVNKCEDGVKCTEAEHDLNRRSEFIITKM
ncbi:OmpA family protein [Kordia jejudonensis]|uniref:OmpA family protein n=1 Tax=Kordia jejudonensis TaxID=1348245 RepID=UPI0006296DB5|nr:OmpA family protein [Kordia jejudonensis]